MRRYHDHPQYVITFTIGFNHSCSHSTQMAFILNSNLHWYTLRRFGRVSPDPSLEADPGYGHWFNLNSSLKAPERVGKLYLGMVLHQAETEGSVTFFPHFPMVL